MTRWISLMGLSLALASCTQATLGLNAPTDGDTGASADGAIRDVGPGAGRDRAVEPGAADGMADAGPPPDRGAPRDLAAPDAALDLPPVDRGQDPDPPPDQGPVEPPPPVALSCRYPSATFGQPRLMIDVGPDSPERLRFVVEGLPDPLAVDEAILAFDSYDADHPGEEGFIWINGQGPYLIPADAAWDNQEGTGRVDITGDLVAGRNRIEFGPGPLPRSFFGIANVELFVQARIGACDEAPPPPPPPPPDAVRREIRYPAARYTNRATWVLGCENSPLRAYAFTARGAEHLPDDCEGLYRDGGNRRGDAIFRFEDVVEAEYDIVIRSRHTENRNPQGALFLVNGEPHRVSQRSDRGFTEDVWGRRRLSGGVEVILRAEGNSDSVIFVRLEPVGR